MLYSLLSIRASLGPLYTKARSREDLTFQPMGGLKIEIRKPKECHFTPEIFSPKTTGRENDMESTFVLHSIKSAQFFESPGILVRPTSLS
jgi:hypothetical protein